MFKKLICFATALLLVLASGCAAVPDASENAVLAASSSDSGPEGAALWLAERLSEDYGCPFTANGSVVSSADAEIVLAAADTASEYGIDVDSLDSEGYVIRRSDGSGSTLIVAPTFDGLDRAVRYFANNCELYGELSVTEGEGFRVGQIIIAGQDLSQFVIARPAGADDKESPAYDPSILYAASELQKYLRKACGVEVPIVTDEELSADSYAISLVKDPTATLPNGKGELGIEGFNISSVPRGITITGGLYSGCLHGVYIFLEDYIGWRFYYELSTDPYASSDDASEYLYEAECVTVPTDIDQTEHPSVGFRCTYGTELHSPKLMYNGWGNWGNSSYGTFGYGDNPCHGISDCFTSEQLEAIGRGTAHGFSMCYTSPELLGILCDNIITSIDDAVARGSVPGKDQDVTSVDISHMDQRNFCMCESCLEVISEYGAVSAAEVYGANYVASCLEEKYPEVLVGMFAYAGTCVPPKNMELHPQVLVSYCFYINDNPSSMICGNHNLSPVSKSCRSAIFVEQFEVWRSLAENIHVWYYPGPYYQYVSSHPCIHELYYDMQFLAEHETYGIYALGGAGKSSMMFIHFQLTQRLLWDASISYEEFEALYHEITRLVYGDGGDYICEYFDLLESAANMGNKCGCWTNLFSPLTLRFDFTYIKENADILINLHREARRLAPTAYVESCIDLLFTDMYFLVCAASHTELWINGDEEDREVYTERLDTFIDLYYNVALPFGWSPCEGGFIAPPETLGYDTNPIKWFSWNNFDPDENYDF